MNTLNLIRKAITKRDALTQSQRLRAKAYRGVPYVNANVKQVCKADRKVLNYRGINYQTTKWY